MKMDVSIDEDWRVKQRLLMIYLAWIFVNRNVHSQKSYRTAGDKTHTASRWLTWLTRFAAFSGLFRETNYCPTKRSHSRLYYFWALPPQKFEFDFWRISCGAIKQASRMELSPVNSSLPKGGEAKKCTISWKTLFFYRTLYRVREEERGQKWNVKSLGGTGGWKVVLCSLYKKKGCWKLFSVFFAPIIMSVVVVTYRSMVFASPHARHFVFKGKPVPLHPNLEIEDNPLWTTKHLDKIVNYFRWIAS